MDIITSRQNGRFKEIRKLVEDKKYRGETGLFFVDGVNFVAQAMNNGWEVRELVYVPDEINSEFKEEIVSRVPENKHFPIDIFLYETLSTKKDIQGVGAVIKQKTQKNILLDGTGVVLENIANPGNLGSIARLCAAFDIKNLYVIKPAVEFFHPDAVRASMGAIFHLNLITFDSVEQLKKTLEEKPTFCLGTSLQADAVSLPTWMTSQVERGEEVLIFFGSEAKGLTDEAKKLCQTLVKIPISAAVDSLNVAESVAIVLYGLFVRK